MMFALVVQTLVLTLYVTSMMVELIRTQKVQKTTENTATKIFIGHCYSQQSITILSKNNRDILLQPWRLSKTPLKYYLVSNNMKQTCNVPLDETRFVVMREHIHQEVSPKGINEVRSLVVSDLRLETKDSRLLTQCRGELSAVIAQLLSKCL